jgi:hypothetical protein
VPPVTSYRAGFANNHWYVFVPVSMSTYNVFTLPPNSPIAPPEPTISSANFDIEPWYNNNKNKFSQVTSQISVTFGTAPHALTVTTDVHGQTSTPGLAAHGSTPCSWNEIGN